MKIELTQDEMSLAAYAIRELANRRQEQVIEALNPEMQKGLHREAKLLSWLNEKLYQAGLNDDLPKTDHTVTEQTMHDILVKPHMNQTK